ncbi:MAG: leucyl aminopeptidase [Tissierellia bacterium]|nr:leucyl aminopeptidase [Tissierellia bacterium]
MKFTLNKSNGLPVSFRWEKETKDDFEKDLYNRKVFTGKGGEVYPVLYGEHPKIYAGLGKKEEFDLVLLKDLCFNLAKLGKKEGLEALTMDFISYEGICKRRTIRAMVEGFSQIEYKFDRYLKKEDAPSLQNVNFNVPEDKEDILQEGVDEALVLNEAIFHTRDLVNTPAVDMGPTEVSNYAKEVLEPLGVKVTIFDEAKIKELKMEAFLSVAKGSDKEPKFLIMEYYGNPNSDKKIGFVGKGLTYDSGGYCIKPPKGMATMQSDMAGSATVIGAIEAIAKNKLDKNVIGVAALCENMISGKAYHTGDIIGSLSGKTIEVGNTDAEGRITLADSLYYMATEFKPDCIIDLATLTGACIVALGDLASGVVTNNKELLEKVQRAANISDEPIWELPNFKGYKKYIKSEVADIYNTSKIMGAGTITAGLFLENFVEEIPWVHMDIAGTAWLDRQIGSLPKGGTGTHVKTLYHFVKTAKF